MHVLDFQHLDPGDVGSPDALLSLMSTHCPSNLSILLCPVSDWCAVGGQGAGDQG
ncbi:hypothetical protein O7606_16095 [Micromonospora sp. WMMD882]|uniref:hypothetical protein n=1 Tax=Micromonospora sp. WMMD882 TaxID=3015151 RepID=UPI00248CA133|nr:hypothetical protein [Micromonospora sp. WMMD882]WBB77791.1 hypothetical protein O7606_16095 [Micromonospora sp. WMMD882]